MIADAGRSTRRPIYVWGTGTNALHLLASSRLRSATSWRSSTRTPTTQGDSWRAGRSWSPATCRAADAPILVTSAISQTAIASAARELFGPDVPLILMY